MKKAILFVCIALAIEARGAESRRSVWVCSMPDERWLARSVAERDECVSRGGKIEVSVSSTTTLEEPPKPAPPNPANLTGLNTDPAHNIRTMNDIQERNARPPKSQ